MTPECRICGAELNEENWYIAYRKTLNYICKICERKQQRLRYKANPEKKRARATRLYRKQHSPFKENPKCSLFFGIHVAERVLSHVFKDVQVMPHGNPGYDFICNKGKRIDVKSSCTLKIHKGWSFNINRNTTADFFLCLAFDNREDLNPIHAWLIPGSKLNHIKGASISPSTIHKWDEYRLDISKILDCCDTIR